MSISVTQSHLNYSGTPKQPFASIVPGMAICYLSDGKIPEGFIELKPDTQWPSASWVRSGLRSTPLPDMNQALIGGGSAADVGSVSAAGTIAVNGTITLLNVPSQILGISQGYSGEVITDPPTIIKLEDPQKAKDGPGGGGGFGGRAFVPRPAVPEKGVHDPVKNQVRAGPGLFFLSAETDGQIHQLLTGPQHHHIQPLGVHQLEQGAHNQCWVF